MATAEPGVSTGFQVGDIYAVNGQPGQIAKITNNGNTVINPWVTLSSPMERPRDRSGAISGSTTPASGAAT